MDIENLAKQKDIDKGRDPKILYYDLEVSPQNVWTYDSYDATALRKEKDKQIVSVSWQWEGEKKIHVRSLPMYDNYVPGRFKTDDKELVREFQEVISQADLYIGHNERKFDYRILNTRILAHGFPPLPKHQYFDTLKKARKYFSMYKNTLEEIYMFVSGDTQGKTRLTHHDLIWDCLDGDMKAWRAMEKYNERDIFMTQVVYKAMRPFDYNHPNLTLYKRDGFRCKACLSTDLYPGHQTVYLRTVKRVRFDCETCGHSNYFGKERGLEINENY